MLIFSAKALILEFLLKTTLKLIIAYVMIKDGVQDGRQMHILVIYWPVIVLERQLNGIKVCFWGQGKLWDYFQVSIMIVRHYKLYLS